MQATHYLLIVNCLYAAASMWEILTTGRKKLFAISDSNLVLSAIWTHSFTGV